MKRLVPHKLAPPKSTLFDKIPFREFVAICELFIWCYSDLKDKKMFILGLHEGRYRTMILKHVRLNKERFAVNHFKFFPEVGVYDDDDEDIKGRVDILATSNNWTDENWYYAFECKRLKDNSKNDSYINDGLSRYVIDEKYSHIMPYAGMIGFIEKGKIDKIVLNIEKRLMSHTEKAMHGQLRPYIIKGFKYCFVTSHERIKSKRSIEIYHMFFDLQ